MICKILGLFVNTLTADERYSLANANILTQQIQMQLPKKQKIFSECFPVFFKSRLGFEHFEKNVTLIAYVFPNLQTEKDVVRKMSSFTRPFEKQHSKRSQILLKSARQTLYHI